MRRRCLFSLFAALSVAACAHPVTPVPVEPMSWGLVETPDENKLAYGEPGTDNVVLMLACEPRSGEVLVTLVDHEDRAAPVMTLHVGRAASRRPAEAQPDMMTGGFLIEAVTAATDPTLERFRRGEPLTVQVGARRTQLPPAADEGRRFVEGCRAA
ncbi:hypothetical protein LRS10_12395 [Phenylobacterium sp. J426]|uniref:hypothetical protein n=1 Tax=Phenylobacterium sp. J426 TaxID=2898439 RepID=UPI002150A011|nr:hypothetical protein [Phenylobacterium sp. J426]MCR5874902.1 hypothetical protein [Phenylobacterium sp. J426]